MSATWMDERISILVAEGGIESYGFFWRMTEIVALAIEDGRPAECTYPTVTWPRLFGLLGNKFQRLAKLLAKCGLIEMVASESLLKVSMPNILKYRDEYNDRKAREKAKNRDDIPTSSRQTHEQELDSDTEADTDTDIKKAACRDESNGKPAGTGKPSLASSKISTTRKPAGITEEFLSEMKKSFPEIDVDAELRKLDGWLATPRGKGKARSQQRFYGWLTRARPASRVQGNGSLEEPEESFDEFMVRFNNIDKKPKETHGR